mmetsp:Transcript_25722/g.68311  ORF Transcript_25722/g.68311 Transcript_25722/m.68311 type:complete len:209 (-) Transcript_25722:106-732(-)
MTTCRASSSSRNKCSQSRAIAWRGYRMSLRGSSSSSSSNWVPRHPTTAWRPRSTMASPATAAVARHLRQHRRARRSRAREATTASNKSSGGSRRNASRARTSQAAWTTSRPAWHGWPSPSSDGTRRSCRPCTTTDLCWPRWPPPSTFSEIPCWLYGKTSSCARRLRRTGRQSSRAPWRPNVWHARPRLPPSAQPMTAASPSCDRRSAR